MKVYRISLRKWSKKLAASGYAARWNSKGSFVIYTASSRALACLENVVHRSGEGLNSHFKVMIIEIPAKVKVKTISIKKLPPNWYKFESYSITQKLGDNWLEKQQSAVLKVPSSVVPKEFNYLINPNHKDFKYIKLVSTEDFKFDPRIKNV